MSVCQCREIKATKEQRQKKMKAEESSTQRKKFSCHFLKQSTTNILGKTVRSRKTVLTRVLAIGPPYWYYMNWCRIMIAPRDIFFRRDWYIPSSQKIGCNNWEHKLCNIYIFLYTRSMPNLFLSTIWLCFTTINRSLCFDFSLLIKPVTTTLHLRQINS